jgi:hypothetical protein
MARVKHLFFTLKEEYEFEIWRDRTISGPKRVDTTDVAEPCTLRSCINCTVQTHY